MISCLRAAGQKHKALTRRTSAPGGTPPPLPLPHLTSVTATDPEPCCSAVDSSSPQRRRRRRLTYEFVTHCQSYQSSPRHCRVDSPPCRCTHGTCRSPAPTTLAPTQLPEFQRSPLLSTCMHWPSQRPCRMRSCAGSSRSSRYSCPISPFRWDLLRPPLTSSLLWEEGLARPNPPSLPRSLPLSLTHSSTSSPTKH